jgi:hypothetical protein
MQQNSRRQLGPLIHRSDISEFISFTMGSNNSGQASQIRIMKVFPHMNAFYSMNLTSRS